MLVEPIQGDGKRRVQCYVVRHKQRVGSTRFDFYMCLSKEQDMYCFTGRKQKVAKGCYYSISLDSDERKRSKGQSEESQFIGKVRSDRKAVEYWLYDDGANPEKKEEHGPLRREMLFVSFVNSLRNRNPGAMEVVVPGVDAAGDAVPIRPSVGKDGTQELLKKNDLTSIVPLKNREPKWNPQSNMYQLDFNGRATLASCKNIQLHPKNGADSDVVFLMGKVEENKFNVDFKAPLSCMQAFAFALIVFDNSSGAF